MKTLITQSQESRNEAYNRRSYETLTKEQRDFLQKYCYNMNDDAPKLQHCKYEFTNFCPKECFKFDRRYAIYRSGSERFEQRRISALEKGFGWATGGKR